MKKLLISLILLSILIISSCCEKSTGPDEDKHHIGWIVGDPDSGYGAIFKTTNSGQTWVRQGDSLTVPNITLNAVRAIDSLTAWVVGEAADGYATILKTTNGGQNWQRLSSKDGLPDTGLMGLCVYNDFEIWAVGGANTIIYSNNGGTNWVSKADTSFLPFGLCSVVAHGEDVWVCGNDDQLGGTIMHSSDTGDTWRRILEGPFLEDRGMIELSAPTDSCIWVVGHGRTILHSTNAGQNWTIQAAEVFAAWDANGVTAISEDIAWVAEDTGGIYHTTNGGVTWEQQTNTPLGTTGYYLYRISPINEKIAWIVGPSYFDGIILYTVDGGETWTSQNYSPAVLLGDVSFVGSYH